MQALSLNRISVPQSLANISQRCANEIADERSDQVWASVENLFQKGMNGGISLAIYQDDKLRVNRAIGYAQGDAYNKLSTQNTGALQPLTLDTPICIYSASKAVTAMLVHWADEQGLINVLDPVAHYLPDFAVNGKKNITIQQVLTHRAGIATLPKDEPVESLYDYDKCVQLVCNATPEKKHRHHSAYHALTGGYVLSAVLEKVTGKAINELLYEVFAEPMGMKYFQYGLAEQYQGSAAQNYATGVKPMGPMRAMIEGLVGADLPTAIAATNDVRFQQTVCPAGNMYATAEELSRFYEMLRNGGNYQGKQILRPETIARAVVPHSPVQIDKLIKAPMRFSMGMMLGHKRFSVLGSNTEGAYGHLGLISIVSYADPARRLSASLLTTGKTLIGPHLLAYQNVLSTISKAYTP